MMMYRMHCLYHYFVSNKSPSRALGFISRCLSNGSERRCTLGSRGMGPWMRFRRGKPICTLQHRDEGYWGIQVKGVQTGGLE
jgi:hypothetical protein